MAWTITEAVDQSAKIKSQHGDSMHRVKLTCTSDAGASSHTVGSVTQSVLDIVEGSFLYLVKFEPGTGGDIPDAAFDMDIEDDGGDHILDTDANSKDAVSFVSGADTLGVFPPIFKTCTMVCATLGNGNKANIYLYFSK
jgi:hypothetical protein